MILKMKVDFKGSEDGIHVQTYFKGKEYEINSDLARVFLTEGVAVKVADYWEEKAVKPVSNKAIESTPENKADIAEEVEEEKSEKEDKKQKGRK